MSKKQAPKSVAIHAAAQQAVNTPPSRNPVLMKRLFEVMHECRAVALNEHAAASLGLEATLAGALAGVLPEDTVTVLLSGEAVRIALVMREKNGPRPARAGRQRFPLLLECAPEGGLGMAAGTQIALSGGIAMIKQARQERGVVVALCGDTPSLREAREGMLAAATHKLPLVIITEHNMAAKKTARHPRTADLAQAARKCGVPGMTVDGSDVMAVYRVTQEALYRARHAGGPTLIECKTWRPGGRQALSMPPARLRPWVQGDPLQYMERQMKARGFWSEEWAREFASREK